MNQIVAITIAITTTSITLLGIRLGSRIISLRTKIQAQREVVSEEVEEFEKI